MAFSVKVPPDTLTSSTAVNESPSTSVSLMRTPAAATTSCVFSSVMYESSSATGASSTPFMVSVTVAELLICALAVTVYVNEAGPV